MRSYWDHLAAIKNKSEAIKNPVFRASAIFPVINSRLIKSRVIFLGYWMVKRKINSIGFVVTLRGKKGVPLARNYTPISEAKAYRVELQDLLENEFLQEEFKGSLELEFFSSAPLVFAFPATTVNYYGENFSTFVHTAERIFNSYEDYKANAQTKVSESGFNISIKEDTYPFFAFVNGPIGAANKKIKAQFINNKGDHLLHEFNLRDLNPYETRFIYPSQEIDLRAFLNNDLGTAKLNFDLPWAFPRLLVGNFQKTPFAASITHTYYDCTEADSEKDYWLVSQDKWVDASLMLPIIASESQDTVISIYPIYTPSEFILNGEIYDENGVLQGKGPLFEVSKTKPQFIRISMKEFLKTLNINLNRKLSLRLTANRSGLQPIPSRIKIALDITQNEKAMGCNICTNLQPFNPELEQKLKSFRWLPIVLDPVLSRFLIFVTNSSPEKQYVKKITLHLTFYREGDGSIFQREVQVEPHGTYVLEANEDEELKSFINGKTGWMTIESENPYLAPYYLSLNAGGSVGGDHGY